MKTILGIDAGTSNVKAVLFDEKGLELYSKVQESGRLDRSGNQVEQDMNLLWEKVKSCIRELMQEKDVDPDDIIGIGIAGQGEGCWLIDKDGEPVQNAILWCDGRAVEEVSKLAEEQPDLGAYYYRTTGTKPLMGGQMILLSWMKHNRPEVLERADKVLFCKDWIRYKLTGKIGTDLTDAMTTLLDVQTDSIADTLMKKLELEQYRSYLSEPRRSDELFGEVKDEIADELGLKRHTPVIVGALDTAATAVGLGAIHEKDACVILGTTCAGEIVFNKKDCNFGSTDTRYERHPLGDLFVELQATLNGTTNINWMLENIALTNDFAQIDKIVQEIPVGCGGVVYHPYISVAGERAPFFHPYARGDFFGISQMTTRGDLIRAVYEGLSMSIRDCLAHVDRSGTLYLAGGGAKSPVWAQMISDVVGMPVKVSDGKELGAKGVALMVGVACGLYRDYDEAVEKTCSFRQVYHPNKGRAQKYDLLFDLYVQIREHNIQMWDYRHHMNKKMKQITE